MEGKRGRLAGWGRNRASCLLLRRFSGLGRMRASAGSGSTTSSWEESGLCRVALLFLLHGTLSRRQCRHSYHMFFHFFWLLFSTTVVVQNSQLTSY